MSNTPALKSLGRRVPTTDSQSLPGIAPGCGLCHQMGVGIRVEAVRSKCPSSDWLRIPLQLASLSDEVLLFHVREGCFDAMGLLFDRHCALVSNIAFKLLRSSAEAQVVVEEVFYEVFLNAKEFDSKKASVEEWFVRSAYVRSVNRTDMLKANLK
jgi:hypothetical protein